MAAKSSLFPLLRPICRPYTSIQKFTMLASSQFRLFHASNSPIQSILNPELGGLQRMSALRLFRSGFPASSCRNYARGRKLVSEDDDDDGDDGDEDFGGDFDKIDEESDFDEDKDDKGDASDEE